MKSMISVNNSIQKDTMNNMSGTITTIFDSAMQNHISQKNVGKALNLLLKSTTQGNIAISDCNLSNAYNKENCPKDGITGTCFEGSTDYEDKN